MSSTGSSSSITVSGPARAGERAVRVRGGGRGRQLGEPRRLPGLAGVYQDGRAAAWRPAASSAVVRQGDRGHHPDHRARLGRHLGRGLPLRPAAAASSASPAKPAIYGKR
ncbi:hypothetical protein [Nonomuraea sp. SBT364]|uniref:hypothetical protein n=1 Tax=Nonomuraea sp. SBT364 TaxID=1580530 RepID=UPI0012E240C5|nr:hypothetical protein [Nonomuraea sp. SBT364]